MNRRILFGTLLLVFLVSSVGLVCAEDNYDEEVVRDTTGPIDLSGVGDDSSNVEVKDTLSTPQIDNENKLKNSNLEDCELGSHDSNQVLSGTCPSPVPVEDLDSDFPRPWLIVDKYWEGNDSGNITYVEIELWETTQKCPPKWKSSEDDLAAEPITMDVVGEDGEVRTYVLIETVKILKENNWRHVFKNLTGCNYHMDPETNQWVYPNHDFYLIREINIPENVENISARFVSYKTCTADGGLKIFWNLTNRYIPNETDDENETIFLFKVPVNETEPLLVNETTPVVENNSTNEITVEKNETTKTVERPTPNTSEKKSLDVANATGNPLVLLLMVIAILGAGVFKRD